MVKEMFYDVQPTPNTRIYELERRVGNLEEALHFWINDFKQKLDIKTVQISIVQGGNNPQSYYRLERYQY